MLTLHSDPMGDRYTETNTFLWETMQESWLKKRKESVGREERSDGRGDPVGDKAAEMDL